jgi:hypothetical protein
MVVIEERPTCPSSELEPQLQGSLYHQILICCGHLALSRAIRESVLSRKELLNLTFKCTSLSAREHCTTI